MGRLPAVSKRPLPVSVDADLAAAATYARAEKAEATRRAYRADFRIFASWCAERGLDPLAASPDSAAAFLAWDAGQGAKPSTIGRRVAAIRYAYKLAGLAPPTDDERVRATVRGIRRKHGAAPRQKAPATAERVLAMVASLPSTPQGLRDRALLLLGFAGAFRRSEVVALDFEDIEETAEGLRIAIRRGKTDQEGRGVVIAIPRGALACPVAAVKTWLDAAGITAGPVFRSVAKGDRVTPARLSDRSVANIVKRHAAKVGLDPGQFGGHSLRSGFLTSAAVRGASIFKMMEVSRHRSMDTVRGYVREAELFRNHAGSGLL